MSISLPQLPGLATQNPSVYEAFQTLSRLGMSKADVDAAVKKGGVGSSLVLAPATITLANGVNTDITIPTTNSFIRIVGPTAVFSISGISGGIDGRVLIVFNTTAFAMTLNNAAGSVQNRIIAPGSPSPSIAIMIYDTSLQFWRLTAYL